MVVEDILGGLSLRGRRGAGLGLGIGFGCGLKSWCANGFRWLLNGGLQFQPGCGRGLCWGLGLGGGGVAQGGDGFAGPFGRLSQLLGGGVLDQDVMEVTDVAVVVVEVVESEAEEAAVGDRGGSWAAEVGVRCWVL